MDWTSCIRIAIGAMEEHLLDKDCVEQACCAAGVSPMYLQQGFRVMAGMSMSEYVRSRRLYKAALELASNPACRVLDAALKYGYDTPESFAKAFSRFHGASPALIRRDTHLIRVFQPLRIQISILGGMDMDFTIENMHAFTLIGFSREISYNDSYQTIPQFWTEYHRGHIAPLQRKAAPESEIEQVIRDCRIGEYGVCIDSHPEKGMFTYMIAGEYHGGPVPEGMATFSFDAMQWAKFPCVGPMPGALQSVNTKVFKEWLPGNPDYQIAVGANIEWYAAGDGGAEDYQSAIWVPVKPQTH